MEMNPNNNQNEIGRQKEQADSARKQQTDLEGIEFRKSIIYLIRMWQELVKVLLM